MDRTVNIDVKPYQAVIGFSTIALGIQVRQGYLTQLYFLPADTPLKEADNAITHMVVEQLKGYLNNPHFQFSLPIKLSGTDHQLRVWEALRAIPSGKVYTYGRLSKDLASSPRAVGGACRNNPIPIVIPCHRVVAQSGIGGFAGQREGHKIAFKEWLLRHEGAIE